MAGFFIVIPFVLFIAFAIFLIALGQAQARQRQELLGRWAAKHGLSFQPDDDDSFEDRYAAFSCFTEGDDRHAYNVMQGASGDRRVLAFDYHYETEHTDSDGDKDTDDHDFSAVIVHTGLAFKPLSIRGETFGDSIGRFFGGGDIELESAEFNSEFHVTSPDRRWTFDVLPQTTMEFLLKSPRFVLEIQNDCVLAYTDTDHTFSTDEFESALDVVLGFLDRIPPSVRQELESAKLAHDV